MSLYMCQCVVEIPNQRHNLNIENKKKSAFRFVLRQINFILFDFKMARVV